MILAKARGNCRGVGYLADEYHPVPHLRAGDGVVQELFNFSAQLPDGAAGAVDLRIRIHGFHGQERPAGLHQRQRQLAQHWQRRHCPGHGVVVLFPMVGGEFLRPGVDAGNVFQI